MKDTADTMPLEYLKKLAGLATDFRSRFNKLVYADDSLLAAFNEAAGEKGIKDEAIACSQRLETSFETMCSGVHARPAYEHAERDWSAATIRLSELYADIADRILPYAGMNEIIPFAAHDRKAIHDGFMAVDAPTLADFYF